jgi:hypothetical protein
MLWGKKDTVLDGPSDVTSRCAYTEHELKSMTLEQLFSSARSYGCIYLHEFKDGRRFSFTISFETIPGTELKASSGADHKDIASAIIEAIKKAELIRSQFK